MIRKGTCEAEIVDSNPGYRKKNRTRAYSRDLRRERGVKKKIFFIFILSINIYFNTQKNGV